MLTKAFQNHLRCRGSSDVSAYAVCDDHQIAQGDAEMKDGVIVLLAQDSAVTLLGENNGWLFEGRNFVHL